MNIKKIVKLSFLLIIILFLALSSIKFLILNQLKENNQTKTQIAKLISLQENMNALLKNVKNSKDINSLNRIKKSFSQYEKNFEKAKAKLLDEEHSTLLDLMRNDIHKDKDIKECMTDLLSNEKKIEISFDKIFEFQTKYIKLYKSIKTQYKDEKLLRNSIKKDVLKTKNLFLVNHFGDMKYYSKEALFQYRDRNSLDKWVKEIDILHDKFNKNNDIKDYKVVVEKLGNKVILLTHIERSIDTLKEEIKNILESNKKVNEIILISMEKISNDFFDFIYKLMVILLVVSLIIIFIIAYKVNNYVGLSVDEIEQKVDEATEEIENLNKEIEDTQKEVVFTMGAIGERRSKETGNHVKRVAQYSKILALKYGLSEDESEMLKQASPMHDIGKVAIPDAILNKPGRFTPQEREIMNTHAQLGYDMLKSSTRPLLKTAAIVAYEHHEKWDGTGYPRGLKEDEIHIYGRITAVADVFDALGSDRVYKKAWEDERIFKLLKDEKGKQFDPKLIDIFFDNLDKFLEVREKFKDSI